MSRWGVSMISRWSEGMISRWTEVSPMQVLLGKKVCGFKFQLEHYLSKKLWVRITLLVLLGQKVVGSNLGSLKVLGVSIIRRNVVGLNPSVSIITWPNVWGFESSMSITWPKSCGFESQRKQFMVKGCTLQSWAPNGWRRGTATHYTAKGKLVCRLDFIETRVVRKGHRWI